MIQHEKNIKVTIDRLGTFIIVSLFDRTVLVKIDILNAVTILTLEFARNLTKIPIKVLKESSNGNAEPPVKQTKITA